MMCRRTNALTLIELLVVTGIASVLLAMGLLGVQSARTAARRTLCINNLRQLGIAFSNYHESFHVYPVRDYPFQSLLPFLSIADMKSSPAVFVCTEDAELQTRLRQVSYALNEGYAYQVFGANGVTRPLFSNQRPTTAAEITDGLSNTSCLSERLVNIAPNSIAEASRHPLRSFWLIGTSNRGSDLDSVNRLLQECEVNRSNAIPNVQWSGNSTLSQRIGYNHMLAPNNASCHQMLGQPLEWLEPQESVLPPSSLHVGVVHLSMLDTSVHTIPNAIDLAVWHAIGTRSGGESVALPSP